MSPHRSTKYLQPTTRTTTTPSTTSYHLDSDNEAHSDCSPRGSISLATSDDNLLPPHTPVSTAPHPHPQAKPTSKTSRRPAPRTVHFAEKSQLTTSSPAPVYPPLNKSQKAKQVATSTLKGAGTVAGGIFGCICYIFAKACILDGGSGLSGSGSRVVVARAGEQGFVQGNRRVVEMDGRGGYPGYYYEEKRRARVPARVRVGQQQQQQQQQRTRSGVQEQRSYRAQH